MSLSVTDDYIMPSMPPIPPGIPAGMGLSPDFGGVLKPKNYFL